HILHGVENNTERAIKSGYEDKYNDAITKKATMMTVETMDLDLDGNGIIEGEEANRIVKRGNILTGIVGERSSALSINDSDYNKWVREDSTLTSGVRTALTLGLQTDKYNTKIIGFWPYNGTNLSRNRCAILEYDYDNALYFAKQKEKEDEEAGSGEALSSSSKGGIFFFVIDDAIAGSVNGDTRVDEVDAQQILEVSTGSMKVGELAIPEAVDVPGGNPKAYEVNAQIVLDYSVTSEKPW
ncbi:MAG: hypothetical protein IKW78_05965, partial [Prevotella sp.]|nr:hypothetical protein [Prevotella sp.]